MLMLSRQCLFFLLPFSLSWRFASQNLNEAPTRAASPSVPEMLCSSFKQPKIAVCFHGSARSFPNAIVYKSQKQNLINALGADVSAFLHLTRKDARGDERAENGGHFPDATVEQIKKAAAHMEVPEERMKILEGPNAELPQCPNYELNIQERKQKGNWYQGMPGVLSLAGQLSHKEGCMSLIRKEEARTQQKFDEVILARADTTFYTAMQPYCFFDHKKPRRFWDWYAHVTRDDADQLFSVPYNAFYGCKAAMEIGQTVESYVLSKIGIDRPKEDRNVPIFVTRLDESNMPNNLCRVGHIIYNDEVKWSEICGPVTYQNPFNKID